MTCHSERGKAGGLSLAAFDASKILDDRDLTEKIIRKLRAKMMPPAGAKRPEGTALADMAAAFEARIDAEAERTPSPGSRSFLRLNRAEYGACGQGPAGARHRRHRRCCRPTPSATASTTSPTRRPSRRR